MDYCEILYSSENKASIKRGLNGAIKRNWTPDMVLELFKPKEVSQQIRYKYSSIDTNEEISNSLKDFIKDFDAEIKNFINAHPNKSAKLLEIRRQVFDKLLIDLDEADLYYGNSNDSEEETKTKKELFDLNTNNLNKHIADIYGIEAYDIFRTLKEDFDDATTAAGYWDINTGSVVTRSNNVLNENFRNLKNKYYKKIVQYLKDKGILDEKSVDYMYKDGKFVDSDYFNTITKFYRYVKSLPDFKQTLTVDQSNRISGENKKNKKELYKTLVKTLRSDADFDKKLKSLYKGNKFSLAQNELYSADHFSEYYIQIKKLLNDDYKDLQSLKIGDKTVSDYINDIESVELTLLEAVNAYTSLTHFDELLTELHGESFNIRPGTKGLETTGNKYQFHQDTSHEKKGWQQSEAIDSERYIANMTRRVLNQVRIFDHKTNTYQNRRVDSTAFIVASRNLLNDILYQNVSWPNYSKGKDSTKRKTQKSIHEDFIKTVYSLHSAPQERLQKILEYMFDTIHGNTHPYYQDMNQKKLTTDYDLDILYSLYHAVFNKNNPSSLVSQELENTGKVVGTVQNLVQEISGYVDRNTTMDYLETSYDFEVGEAVIKRKKKFFNNKHLYKSRVRINDYVNSMGDSKREELQNKYNFNYQDNVSNSNYSVKIGDYTFNTVIPNDLFGRILTNDNRINIVVTDKDNNVIEDFWKNNIDDINLIEFKDKVIYDSKLENKDNKNEPLLLNILKFLDDTLDLGILTQKEFKLQQLQVYKTLYLPKADRIIGPNYLAPLIQLGIRAAYANDMYSKSKKDGLSKYLRESGDPIYKDHLRANNSRLFSEKYEKVKYKIASFQDEVLEQWADAYSMLTGEASKATTKDKQGNSIPNNSVNKMGCMVHHYVEKQKEGSTSSLLLSQKQHLLRGTLHDLEVTTWNNDIKSIKDFSAGELFYHSVFNKFWGNFFKTGNVIIQPTTYSDKTTFLNYEINTVLDKKSILRNANYKALTIDEYMNTIGVMYDQVWTKTVNNLNAIAKVYNEKNKTIFDYKQMLRNMSEQDLVKYAKLAGVNVELDKDYRIIKDSNGNKILAHNELLEFYATKLYKDKNLLTKTLEKEQINFVQNLISAGSSFQVIDFGDKYEYYTKDSIDQKASSKNNIIYSIKKYFENDTKGRKQFFEQWVDAKTGRLILAKQGKNNIIGIGDNFNSSKNVILNPFLDKFFYVEGLLSNNLRMSLTGSEINHPDKAFDTSYNTAKKQTKKYTDASSWAAALDIKSGDIEGAYTEIINSDYVGDLINSTNEIIQNIYNESIQTISNVAQGTQFKRNVIIPATLQYCQQNTKDGIRSKVKCAVIRDEGASVWNYRGDHEKPIDSADGAAYISPFQSILENKSLGSQAVGFIKKPIWHDYDTENGTAFLAKFATDTITNEAMRASLKSHTSLQNLFKKMTNLQWQGDVDLTESIIYGKIGDDATKVGNLKNWFQVVILGNSLNGNKYIKENKLIYRDAYGDDIEITGFGKTTLSSGKVLYYTEESVFDDSEITTKSQKVYHLFYDVVDETGKVLEKSKHITFDTYQKANKFLDNPGNGIANVHTINSLYELHTSLGGINCVDSKGNYSEFSNEVVVNFMNNVGRIKPGFTKGEDTINQETYEQPLKKYEIGYALNNTAVKEGAKNINQTSSWYDDSDLNYFEVNSDGLGIQMNADHDIVNSELTEFSQVITATSAYGYTYDNTNEIFQGLAQAAIQASKKAIDAVDKFLSANFEIKEEMVKAQSNLYDAIGRIIMTSASIKDRESLQGIIMQAVGEVFYKSKDHSKDSVKLPISDPNVYSEFIATLASTITNNSIKRKHPGSGCVMVPGYNTIQYFEIDGQKLMLDDVLKSARDSYRKELIELIAINPGYNSKDNSITIDGEYYDLSDEPLRKLEELVNTLKIENKSLYKIDSVDTDDISKHFIDVFLKEKQAQAKTFEDNSWFMPSDIVNIISSKGVKTVDLDSLDVYYKFKQGLYDSEIANDVIIKTDYKGGEFKIIKGTGTLKVTKEFGKWKVRQLGNIEDKISMFNSVVDIMPLFGKITLTAETASQLQGLVAVSDVYESETGELVQDFEKREAVNYGNKYQINVTVPHNLRPSLIRWQYVAGTNDDGSEVIKYMNIFDNNIIRDSYTNPSEKSENYRTLIQDELHLIHNGKFTDIDGKVKDIKEGTLENTAAELVMSNIYKEKFGVENESLYEIMQKGEKYFEEKFKKITPPTNMYYDIAFLKEGKDHTLISFNDITPGEYVQEIRFDNNEISTNEKGEIYLIKKNRELFKIGKWVPAKGITFDGTNFIDSTNKVVSGNYRVDPDDNNLVQERLDFVKRYQVINKIENKKSGKIDYKTNTLYTLADISIFKKGFENEEQFIDNPKGLLEDAKKQRASIINKMYNADNFKYAKITTNKSFTEKKLDVIKQSLGFLLNNHYVDSGVKQLLNTQLDSIETVDSFENKEELKKVSKTNKALYDKLEKEFFKEAAHKKWVSFLDSQNFISSRIPAQTLQSFMTMKQIAWTTNSKNMAYVSHFQTYLQGSDYDIDKAYVMGQSYDDNSIYIGWSNLFDYSTVGTLQASKTLPIPKKIKIEQSDKGINVDNLVNDLLPYIVGNKISTKTEQDKIFVINKFAELIRTAEKNNGKINYTGTNGSIGFIIKTMNDHEFYPISVNVAEAAFKNVASANIYAVAHDIRNRDQAYTAISMDILKDAAENSPKGNQAAKLNMLNPLTKYIMQYQNIIGKQVIGIAANGEKMWFNAYYYWTNILKSGDDSKISNLKFKQSFNRIEGRAKNNISKRDITHLPDLDTRDELIKNILLTQFGANSVSMEYKYVDQLISQLLSAATDNAKELILAKINSGTNFAKMYVYAMMSGFNIDDIVAFMTSPAAEFIDAMSSTNIFQNENVHNNATTAINLAEGIIGVKRFLHGNVLVDDVDPDNGELIKVSVKKDAYIKLLIEHLDSDLVQAMRDELQMEPNEEGVYEGFAGLSQAMKALINVAVKNENFNYKHVRPLDLRKLIQNQDTEINSYISYCQDVIEKLRGTFSEYDSKEDFEEDIKEFRKLFNLANEISSISSAWLGLNQGLPTDKLSILKKLRNMAKLVYDREKALNINEPEIYEKAVQKEDKKQDEDEYWEIVKTSKKQNKKSKVSKIQENKQNLIKRLQENNPTLTNIEARLDMAHEAGIINNFDIIKYLENSEYRQQVKDYYGIIMGTFNVFDMMDNIPHYQSILDCFKSLVVSDKQLSSKCRLINKLLEHDDDISLNDTFIKGAIRYSDKLRIKNFIKSQPSIILDEKVEGFDLYFRNISTNVIELDTLAGAATFKHWVEHEFKDWLKEQAKTKGDLYENGAIVHLTTVPDNDRTLLAMDIDLLNPNVTTVTRTAYDSILRGMVQLEGTKYKDTKYTIADILQLYNLIVNSNQYGDERLTTSFKACTSPDNILNKYFKWQGDQDYNYNEDLTYDYIDYLISSAPIISPYQERYHTEQFVKVNDPVRGYIVKKRKSDGTYEEYSMLPPIVGEEGYEDKLSRYENFDNYCPFEMPHSYNQDFIIKSINFKEKDISTPETKQKFFENINNLLRQYSTSSKIILFKQC